MKIKIVLAILLFSAISQVNGQLSFKYKDFKSGTSGLTLLGDALFCDAVLRVTRSLVGQAGACWYTGHPVDVSVGFKTQFTFRMKKYVTSGADGLAFVMMDARQPIMVMEDGERIGYHELKASIAIEFDNFPNYNRGDPNDNHISMHSRGPLPNSVDHEFALGTWLPPYSMEDGNPHKVTVHYEDHLLRLYFDYIPFPVLSIPIDIPEYLGLHRGLVWVGFTSATGCGYLDHDILNWSLRELGPKYKADDGNMALPGPKPVVYPNPFVQELNIAYTLSQPSTVSIDIYSITGQLICGPFQQARPAGKHQETLNAKNLTEGVYFLQLKTNDNVNTIKIFKK